MEGREAAPGAAGLVVCEAPSAREVVRRSLLQNVAIAVVGAFVTLLCVNALARGVAAAEERVAWLLLAVMLTHLAAVLTLHRGFFQDLRALDPAREAGFPDREVLTRGFARVVNAPRYWFLRGFAWFLAGGINLSLVRHALEPDAFPWVHVAVRSLGAVAGGFLFACLLFFNLKRCFEPLRVYLAAELGDPDEARRWIVPIALRTKVLVGVTGALVVAALYGAMLSEVRAVRTAEAIAVHLGRGVLDELAAGRDEVAAARRLGLVERVVIVDPKTDPGLSALAPALAAFEIERLRETGSSQGDSRTIDSASHFAWRTLPDGHLAVAIAPAGVFPARVPAMSGALGVFLGVVLLTTLAVAWLLARDSERAVGALSQEVARFASGDLRRGRPFVWEDELGSLAERLDHMVASLGAMIVGVRATADGVEVAAEGIADASDRLLSTGEKQVRGGESMRASLLSVTGQVEGMSASVQQLSASVDEGSSSIVEMRSAGGHLDQNATLLHEKVDEVSSAVDQLIRSVRDVQEHVEELAGAAVDTSSSMEEMAASLREVDGKAVETSRLSREVVRHAEQGREKVQETLRGMEGIRETTQTARGVIRGLGDRTKEIGAIVNVIDNVAEETNLLALNAAIIAAQAGENGRSFAVVADEIKKLADRVLTSTNEIEQVIRSVQQETQAAVGAIEEGARVVESGVKRAREADGALDLINGSASHSVTRIEEIVAAVAEQSKAASHVVSLMERVRVGSEHIRHAGEEQERGNEAVLRGTEVMREIAQRVRSTTREQALGAVRIADGVESVRGAVAVITSSLAEQSGACETAKEELGRMDERTHAHGIVVQELDASVGRMRADAERLREAVRRFRV